MLLKITYKDKNATDLGFLLHKNPERPQVFDMSFGKAYVFYPEASEEKTTAALLLDVNPIDLARGKLGSRDGGLFDYVNDRPYVSSSFMSTAISKVFSTALSGKCDKKPELVKEKLELEVEVIMLPCSGGKALIDKIFIPLGYETEYLTYVLDDKFLDWGESRYVTLRLKGKICLSELLNHLYVLLPVFDNQKHYWIANEEVDKLISHGEGWLNSHPEKTLITSRYLKRRKSLINAALEKLLEESDEVPVEESTEDDENGEPEIRLNDLRLQTVADKITESGAKTVIDLGCGEGKLLSLLVKNKTITHITGVDVSVSVLEKTKTRIERMPERVKERVSLIQGSLTYKDKRFSGFDAACVVEVIEHLDMSRLSAFERVLFEFAAPPLIILTTPNAEYNVNYENLKENLRHSDHRFEWTRKEFKEWADTMCKKYNYSVEFADIGKSDESNSTPTQMGVFKKCE